MKDNTFISILKRPYYILGLCLLPVGIGMGLGFGAAFDDASKNADNLETQIIFKAGSDEAFAKDKENNLEAVENAHDNGIISDKAYNEKIGDIESKRYVLDYAANNESYKTMYDEYAKELNKRNGLIWPYSFGVVALITGGGLSVSLVNEDRERRAKIRNEERSACNVKI